MAWYWRGGGWAGPWPGRGPFSYLPPWQRPGWLFGFGRGLRWWWAYPLYAGYIWPFAVYGWGYWYPWSVYGYPYIAYPYWYLPVLYMGYWYPWYWYPLYGYW
ncbi:MAG: hypothetical protein B9J98_06815 [Candidatus Terraquivivens tikiterensis]|uniref:Uncharacterized protein n=1 Tax=Candidatus Terraquivivens tikiterensis TaxID=1980982 RepID=A0A2R7Y185_9ARCH|nr:MAG: hypothetical protein B9J98_06815 [Candidatus Terraquivivens tikiterensis]